MLSPDFIEGGAALFLGDCREVMKELPDNSIDAIVTDPPYELAFMAKQWDRTGIAYDVEMWAEALRVAKPGAHLLAFGGTRTHHRLMCAIEDAGWEIRDCLGWVYGCLSEDTELLIDGRWEHYRKAINKGRALCYIPATNEFQWQSIKDFVEYDYDDTAFRILSDSTDQIVSRNHRCLIERGGAFVFEFAEEVALEREARVPILESLSDLLCDLPVPYEGTGFAKQVLQPCLCKSETSEKETARSAQRECGCVFGLREEVLETGCVASQGGDGVLLSGVQRQSAREGMGTTCTQGKVGLDRREHGILRDQDDRSWESGMERWSDLLPQAWQLQTDQVCPMSCGVPADGTQGRLYHGTSTYSCACAREVPEAVRGSSSSESRSTGQQHEQPGSQTVRGTRYTRTDLARVEPFHYRGKVWCIRVPSGAFVARRNGQVFVTGNSGFPKSLDVSKAIDKAAGAEREVVGATVYADGKGHAPSAIYYSEQAPPPLSGAERTITSPATPAARQWSGWGTALKPAWEPIILARKPLIGTVAENVLRHGTGGINVDGCRVDTFKSGELDKLKSRANTPRQDFTGGRFHSGAEHTPKVIPSGMSNKGRFPANIIHDGSDDVLEIFPESKGQLADISLKAPSSKTSNVYGPMKREGEASQDRVYRDSGGTNYAMKPGARRGDSGSAARFFYCCKTSKKERNQGIKGVTLGLEVCLCGEDIEQVTSLERAISAYVTEVDTRGCSTTSYGNESADLYHRVTLSITSTETSKTIESRTWSVWTALPTSEFIRGVIRMIRNSGSSLVASVENISESLNITNERVVSARGVKTAVSETPLIISAVARPSINGHCTVKPLALMRYLCRLITPPGGLVLDPFCGSGSTGKAALEEGFMFFGVEKDRESFDISVGRIMESIKISRAA